MSLITDVMENVRGHFGGEQQTEQTGMLDTLCPSIGSGVVRLDQMNGHKFAGFDELTEGWFTLVNKFGGQTHPKDVKVVILEMESVGDILHIQKLKLA